MTVDGETLGALPLFQGLASEHLVAIGGLLRRRQVPSGMPLITAEEPGNLAYIILSGTVKIYIQQVDGAEVILGIRGAGEVLGELSLIDSQGRSASVVAQEPCTLLWMDRATFARCLDTRPGLYHNLVRILARRLRLATAQIQALATLDVYGRVARQILVLAQEYGKESSDGSIVVPLRLTQSDLAGMVGASRVRVNEVIVSYKRLRYIAVDADYHVTVLNPTALAARCP